MNSKTATKSVVGRATKVAYGVGAVSDSIKTFSFTTFLLFYYTTVLGLPSTWLGIAMGVGLVWDAIVDPLIGDASDRATNRFGRRHSFMLVGSVLAGVSFIAVFNPPEGLSHGQLFAWIMVTSLCLRSCNSLFMVPYYALGAELTTDYHERTSVSGYRAGAVLVGTLLVNAAAFLVFLPSSASTGEDFKFVRASYESMGGAFGFVMVLTGMVATLGTLRERRRLPTSTVGLARAMAVHFTVLETLRNRAFRLLVAASALCFMGTAINAALALHFLTYHARISASQGMTLYFAGFYVGALVGVVVWVRVSQKIDKHKVFAATAFVTGFVMSWGYWLVGEGRPFGTDNLAAVVVASALAGLFGIATGVIAPSMLADVAAHEGQRTGQRRDGVFFGVYSLGQQFSGGLAVLIAAVLVDRFASLAPGQAGQSAMTIDRLAMISNVLPAVILTGAGTLMLRYRLTRRRIESEDAQLSAAPASVYPTDS